MNENKTGTYTGTGAAINIALGFKPTYVRIWNITDGDICWEWFNGMTAGHALQQANHDTAQNSRITSNGISQYAGVAGTTPEGFTVGTALSESGDTFGYYAARCGSGAQV